MFTIPDNNVANCMNFYSLNEQIDSLKHDVGVFKEKEEEVQWKQQKMENNRHMGLYTEVGLKVISCQIFFCYYDQSLTNQNAIVGPI